MKGKNKIFAISGVSGSGHDSVIEGLPKRGLNIERVITTVSRKMRPGESEGRPYYFISEEKFKKMIDDNKFIEWDRHYGVYYGCTYDEYERVSKFDKIIIWKTDMKGVLNIKNKLPGVITIHIKPPSAEAAIQRIKNRNQDSPEVIKQRIEYISECLKPEHNKKFDFNIVNEDNKLDEAVDGVVGIINSQTS